MMDVSVAHVITGLSRGGAENVLYRLIQAQPEPSRHVVVSLTDEGIFGERFRAMGVGVHCLHLRRGSIPSPGAIWRISRHLHYLQPDMIQTWMYHADLLGGIAARLTGIPVCWGVRNSDLSSDGSKKLTRRVAGFNARLSRWVPSRIVSCSARAAEIHRTLGYAEKFVVIPNGLDLTRFKPVDEPYRDAVRGRLGLSKYCKVIGHLGRPDPQKDHATLLKVFAQVAEQSENARLVLAGLDLEHGSAYLNDLLAKTGTSSLANRIVALGQRDDVADLMAAMDVFLLSSSFGEAFPNVVAEAMACGTPCVVTDVGDAAEIVGDTGWVTPPGQVEALAKSVLEALSEPEDGQTSRRHRARQRVEERFDIERMVLAYWDVWENAISSIRGARASRSVR